MGSFSALARRVLTFAPYTLPLWLFTIVPFISHDDVLRWALYLSAIFAVPMVMDLVGGRGANRPELGERPMAEYAFIPRLLFVKFMLVQALMFHVIAHKHVQGIDLAILAAIVGLFYGTLGIVVAHELMHRSSRLDQWLGDLLLVTVTYPWFSIEHVHGHHRTVATPDDPASARKGEALYPFVVRSVAGGLVHAWKLEAERLRRRGARVWSPGNRMLRFAVLIAAYYGVAWLAAGWNGVFVAAGQSAVAIFSLELINYIQHYGLERREIAPGRYERPDVLHSWNWETRFCGLFFLNLGRHSEHHRIANRPYEALEAVEGQPELPGGLMAMYLAALVPPLWFRIMDPRVDAVRRRQALRPLGAEAGAAEPAPPPAPSSRQVRRRQYQALVDAWGGFFIAGLIAAMAVTNEAYGFHIGVALAIGVGLAAVAAREMFLWLPARPVAA